MTIHDCPLCIQPFKDKNPVLIFLDIDEVLINRCKSEITGKIQTTIKELFNKQLVQNKYYTELEWRVAASHHFDEDALKNFCSLIDKIQQTRSVYIILSSGWRIDGTLEQIRNQMFAQHSFSSIIMGKTPPENSDKLAPEIISGYSFESIAKDTYNLKLNDRASQIDFWLLDHKLEKADFIILDDCDDDLSTRFPDRFVKIDSLLRLEEVEMALKILKISNE